ncbi:MAG: hypothetical protein D6741_14655, partial [Planctomycetota bacterium]
MSADQTVETPKRSFRHKRGPRGKLSRVTLSAYGEPMLWLTGGALALCIVMVVGLLGFVFYQG